MKIQFLENDSDSVTIDDLIEITSQLMALIKSGFLMSTAVTFLHQQTAKPLLSEALLGISTMLEKGDTLSNSINEYPHIFPDYYRKSVLAAEISGTLDETFSRLAAYLINQKKMQQAIKKNFMYPNFVMKATFFAVLFLIYGRDSFTISPKNSVIYIIVFLIFLLTNDFLKRFSLSEKGNRLRERLKMSLPVVKEIYRKINNKQFADQFRTIYKSGLNIVEVFRLIGESMNNKQFGEEITKIGPKIEQGLSIYSAVQTCAYFTDDLIGNFYIGSKTGDFDHDLESYVKRLDLIIQDDLKKWLLYLYLLYLLFISILLLYLMAVFKS